MTEKDLTKRAKAGLMKAFKGNQTSRYSDGAFFVIWDDYTNNWLMKKLGLVTDFNEHKIGESFTVRFCWNIQRWYVG